MKILFLCLFGKDRSGTAAELYHGFYGVEAKHGGVHAKAHTPVTWGMIQWAEIIICMESGHRTKLRELFPELSAVRVRCLDIPNVYEKGSTRLKEHIVRAMRKKFPNVPAPLLDLNETEAP